MAGSRCGSAKREAKRWSRIDLLFKLAGLGVVVAVLCQVLTRAGREELSTLVTVVGLVIALFLVVDLVADLFSSLQSIFALY